MKFFLLGALYFVLTVYVDCQNNNANIICTNEVCADKLDCPTLPEACRIQNITHNGIYLPYPDTCNCCKYCLENLKLGDACVSGQPGGLVPNAICGDGLTCDKETSKCVPITGTKCTDAQAEYDKRKDEGKLGHLQLRPRCDRQGKYQPVVCIPGEICYCVDEEGNRLFGEMSYNPQAVDITHCACSRNINKINKVLKETGYSIKRARCLSDGNYDSLQCVGKSCMCVDKIDGHPSDSKGPVHINLATDLSCFDKQIHETNGYYKSCEQKYQENLEIIESYKNDGYEVLGIKLPNCQPDGGYAAVQEDENRKYCSKPDKLEALEKEYSVAKDDPLAAKMNCNCARARSIIDSLEKPICCSNGNYKTIQCRRGKCRCVDTNGNQVESEVDEAKIEELNCPINEECTYTEND